MLSTRKGLSPKHDIQANIHKATHTACTDYTYAANTYNINNDMYNINNDVQSTRTHIILKQMEKVLLKTKINKNVTYISVQITQ